MDLLSSPILITAFSILISWALFAVLCSLIHEAVVQIKSERGRFMKNYLLKQLKDIPNGVNWGYLLFQHGPIYMLSRDSKTPTSDISSKIFAESIIEIVGKAHLVQVSISKKISDQIKYKNKILYDFKAALLVLKPSPNVTFLNQALTSAEAKSSLADGKTDEALMYKYLVENIESWHQELSERLTVWYKKKTRFRLFLLGAILALLINIDSVQLFSFYKNHPDSEKDLINFYQENEEWLQEQYDTKKIDTLKNTEGFDEIIKKTENYSKNIDSLKNVADLPIGSEYSIFVEKVRPHSYVDWLLKFIGILISGFAASFGAPFWFDIIKKVSFK